MEVRLPVEGEPPVEDADDAAVDRAKDIEVAPVATAPDEAARPDVVMPGPPSEAELPVERVADAPDVDAAPWLAPHPRSRRDAQVSPHRQNPSKRPKREVVVIATERLDLIVSTEALVRAAIAGPAELGDALGVRVPSTWPPEFLDQPALEYLLEPLSRPGDQGWWMYFLVLRADKLLVGTAGYKGPPNGGVVEVGYGVVSDHRLKGLASEAAQALIDRAFGFPEVKQVIAETLPELVGSVGVLRRCGFHPIPGSSEPGVIRFGLDRTRVPPSRP